IACQFDQSRCADLVGCKLRIQIAEHDMRHSYIFGDDVKCGFIAPARLVQLKKRDHQSFFVNILAIGRPKPPPYIEMVCDCNHKPNQPAVGEYGGCDIDVWRMSGADPWIVSDENIAILN